MRQLLLHIVSCLLWAVVFCGILYERTKEGNRRDYIVGNTDAGCGGVRKMQALSDEDERCAW